jgi:stringent starvation protein B
MTTDMSSSRPYLIRAIYEWVVDNGMTPQLVVEASGDDVQVPLEYAQDGKIVLNVAPTAVRGLDMGNKDISFGARFSGTPTEVRIPVGRVLAIYARETGQGMMFGPDDGGDDTPPDGGEESGGEGRARPHLKVVK